MHKIPQRPHRRAQHAPSHLMIIGVHNLQQQIVRSCPLKRTAGDIRILIEGNVRRDVVVGGVEEVGDCEPGYGADGVYADDGLRASCIPCYWSSRGCAGA